MEFRGSLARGSQCWVDGTEAVEWKVGSSVADEKLHWIFPTIGSAICRDSSCRGREESALENLEGRSLCVLLRISTVLSWRDGILVVGKSLGLAGSGDSALARHRRKTF